MRLLNQTRNVILVEEVSIAKTPCSRIKGLLGKKFFPAGQALVIEPCNSIHTFFMNFSIDVLFVDKKYKIVKILNDFKPNKFTQIYWSVNKAIEFPSGTLNSSNSQIGDQLQIL